MVKLITLNSKNYVEGSGNKFIYTFPQEQNFVDCKIAVKKFQIYNCTYNISSAIGNNKYWIKWVDGSIYEHTIKDGYYSISDLNYEIQNMMISNNLYTIPVSSSSKYTVYIYLASDDTGYGCSMTFLPVPTDNTTSSLPSGATWNFSSGGKCPQIKLISGLQTLLGMSYSDYFPSVSTSQTTIYNNTTTEIQYVNSYILLCNLVYNSMAIPPNIIHSVALDVGFGYMITDNPFPVYIDMLNARTSQVIIELMDQEYRAVQLKDKEMILVLAIEEPKKDK